MRRGTLLHTFLYLNFHTRRKERDWASSHPGLPPGPAQHSDPKASRLSVPRTAPPPSALSICTSPWGRGHTCHSESPPLPLAGSRPSPRRTGRRRPQDTAAAPPAQRGNRALGFSQPVINVHLVTVIRFVQTQRLRISAENDRREIFFQRLNQDNERATQFPFSKYL